MFCGVRVTCVCVRLRASFCSEILNPSRLNWCAVDLAEILEISFAFRHWHLFSLCLDGKRGKENLRSGTLKSQVLLPRGEFSLFTSCILIEYKIQTRAELTLKLSNVQKISFKGALILLLLQVKKNRTGFLH